MVRAFKSGGSLLAALVLVLGVGLGGCGGGETVQEALGYEQRGPDEMAVIKRPPLIVPPDFNLRPPRPGDQTAAGDAASEAARRTLIGPSSSLENPLSETVPSEDKSPPAEARAILTGATAGGSGSATASASSDGQNLLVDRTNRVERDLDALTATRAENRVDGALLRRLLAFDPEEATETAEGEETSEAASLVQVVKREQTPIDAQPGAE